MQYSIRLLLLTLLLFSRTGNAQSPLIEKVSLEATVSELAERIDSLDALRIVALGKIDSLRKVIAIAEMDSDGDIKVITIGSGLYSGPRNLSSFTTLSGVRGILTGRFEARRVYFISDSGEQGWISTNAFDFLEDPTTFLSLHGGSLNNATVQGYLEQASERFQSGSRKIDNDTAELAFIGKMESKGILAYVPFVRFTVNSADGVAPVVSIFNLHDKQIKYTTFWFRSFNAVGDPVIGRYSESSLFSFRGVGPIEPGETAVYGSSDDPNIYAATTTCLELIKVDIEFMDGSIYVMQNDLADARRNLSDYKIEGECQLR